MYRVAYIIIDCTSWCVGLHAHDHCRVCIMPASSSYCTHTHALLVAYIPSVEDLEETSDCIKTSIRDWGWIRAVYYDLKLFNLELFTSDCVLRRDPETRLNLGLCLLLQARTVKVYAGRLWVSIAIELGHTPLYLCCCNIQIQDSVDGGKASNHLGSATANAKNQTPK